MGATIGCLLAMSIVHTLAPALATAGVPLVAVQQDKAGLAELDLGDQETSSVVAERAPDARSEKVLRNRVIAAAIFGGVVLALLGIVFGYLRMDHATRGFYSGRLQSIAAASAIVVLLIGYLIWVQLIN